MRDGQTDGRSETNIPQHLRCAWGIITQHTIQNRNVHISVLNGALWDMGQEHHVFRESGQLKWHQPVVERV